MAKIETTSAINQIHGKTNGRDRGYFYMRNGKQFYRDRDETYQQNQSPRQKWNSAAFAYANKITNEIFSSPESEAQLNEEYEASNHIASNGKTYSTPRAWKFNSLLHNYKLTHPFKG